MVDEEDRQLRDTMRSLYYFVDEEAEMPYFEVSIKKSDSTILTDEAWIT